jgi:hypothetical protein
MKRQKYSVDAPLVSESLESLVEMAFECSSPDADQLERDKETILPLAKKLIVWFLREGNPYFTEDDCRNVPGMASNPKLIQYTLDFLISILAISTNRYTKEAHEETLYYIELDRYLIAA